MTSQFRIATVEDVEEIGHFLVNHLSTRTLASWTRDVPACVCWYIRSSLCGISEDNIGISAVCLGRPVTTVEAGASNRYQTDWAGDVLWVECVVSREGLKDIWKEAIQFLRSHGCHFKQVAWCRMKRGGKPFVFDFNALNGRLT